MEINNNQNFNNNIFLKIKNILNQSFEPKTQNNNPLSPSSQPLNEFNLTTEENLKLILSTTGILPSEKNMTIVELMLNALIPINKENFKMISNNLNLFENRSFEKLEVLLKNNLELNKSNSNQLERYLSKEINLNEQISELFSNVDNSSDLSNIIKIFTKDDNLANSSKNLFNKLDNIKNEIALKLFKNPEISKRITENLNQIISENNTLENIYSEGVSLRYNSLKYTTSQNSNLKSPNLIPSKNEVLKNLVEISLPNKLIFDKNTLTLVENKLNEEFSPNSNLENPTLKNIEKLIFKELNLKEFNNIIPKIYKFQEKLAEKTSFDFKNSSSKDLNNFISNIKENSNLIKSYLKEITNNEINKEINKTLDNINKNLDFMSALTDTTFLQIPLNINNHQTTAELFLFKNKDDKKNNKFKNSGSALLSLDLANLGHIETYIVKFNSDISCQFRLNNIKIQNFIKENIKILDMYLKEISLNLKEISFKEINESFTLISKEPNKLNSKNKFNFNTFNKQI